MALEPQELISEITEISDYQDGGWVGALAGAVIWGGLIGTSAQMISLLIFAGPSNLTFSGPLTGLAQLLVAATFLTVVIGAITLLGMVLVGLPITALLRATELEQSWLYGLLGSLSGFLVLAIVFGIPASLDSESLFFVGPGGLAGLACAYRWGRWRERVAKARQAEREEFEAIKRANPIHDLIH